MKKYLLIFLLACSAAWTAQAQTTFNIRAGGGYGTKLYYDNGYYGDMGGSVSILLQTNIGLNRRGTLTFSPTFMYSPVFDVDGDKINNLAFPLFFGYKIPFANAAIFYPKLGPCVGVTVGTHSIPIAGPAIELAIEKRHFVAAFDYYYSSFKGGNYQLAFTVGYKF